jgi:hypothetical protein
MKSTANAKGLLLALVCCVVFAVPAVAQPLLPQETFSVEVDVFSGRPNPSFTIEAGELAPVLLKLHALCQSPPGSSIQYPESFLGYRGLLVKRAGALSIALARKGARFAAANPPSICRDKLQPGPAGDLFVSDQNSVLEKHLVELAHQKAALDDVVYGIVVAALAQSK